MALFGFVDFLRLHAIIYRLGAYHNRMKTDTTDETPENPAGESDGHYKLSSLQYPNIELVGEAKSWDDFDREAKALDDLGVKAYLIKKLDSGQYFGRAPDGHWIDVTWAWTKGVAENAERRNVDSSKTRFQDFHTHKLKIVNPRDKLRKAIEDGRFIKNRVCFGVAKYALADVIEALARDQDHNVQIAVTKEDGDLVVMFERRPKPCVGGHADGGPEETGPVIR